MINSCKNVECFTEGVGAPLVKDQENLKSENLNNTIHNLNIEKKNSGVNARNKLENFLIQFTVEKGQEYTHTSH
jgi:hypothetical protein